MTVTVNAVFLMKPAFTSSEWGENSRVERKLSTDPKDYMMRLLLHDNTHMYMHKMMKCLKDSEKVRHKNAPCREKVIYYPRRCSWSP